MRKWYNLQMYLTAQRGFSIYLSACFLFLFLAFYGVLYAATPDSINVDVLPPNPAPGQNVTISLSSFSNNLDSVMIVWIMNGKTVFSGIGKKSFSLTAGGPGTESSIIAQIMFPDGEVDERISVRPNVMVLLWQADDSYTPPFYRGRALPTPDTEIKIVAMPNLNGVATNNMTYDWKKDYNADQGASGYGKNFYTYTNDYLNDSNNIDVVARTINGATSVESNISVGTTIPKILFYKNDPKLGTQWESSLTDGHLITDSEILVAIPYFISPKDLQIPTLVWKWTINDNTVPTSRSLVNFLPVKVPPGTTGTSTIGLDISSTDRIFETANQTLNVQF